LKETVYNLFLYVEDSLIRELGIATHQLDGTEEEKLSTLQALVDQDFKTAKRYHIEHGLEWRRYQALMRLGRQLEVFEGVFRDCNAPINPLVVITPIVDESPKIVAVSGMGPLALDKLRETPQAQPGVMVDYLEAYVEDGQFDIPRLINDDYFSAIKLLFNAGHFVSAAKLLMSFLDTVAFIDLGDVRGNFSEWLDLYADLNPLGITSKELWEFRNGLLHMTNLRSRAIASGVVAPLIFYVGSPKVPIPESRDGSKFFSLKLLIDATAAAVERWIKTYNVMPQKLAAFISRYDLTVSDSRVAYMSFDQPQ
jgi:hypothetical protein